MQGDEAATEATASEVTREAARAPGPGELAPGDRVGHYVIREIIGEGGFAVVYAADQDEPVKRRVALKLIKPGMDTRQVIGRFEAERQALAVMDHPNVAKVLDAGTTETGRPYFVMEHVPGVPITEHCDRQRLNTDERLAMFIQVCQAVQHAHQKGIVHRDLKPSNVLVVTREGAPQVKVIDFGVAKAIAQKLTERTIYTEQGQLIGTPEYMSPEQAEMTAQDIDTRSDIYSLGVLLYEMLTGTLPFDPTTLRAAGFAEIQRIIREEDPPRPSTRLSSLGEESAIRARKRRSDTRTIQREVRGDLDWIVMRCLEKDRTRRYETANGLAMDIQRHLSDEPVLAGPPSASYRMSKFVRRHRVGVGAGTTIFAVLVAAVIITAAALAKEAEQRREAQLQASIAEAVNKFLNDDLLAAVAPSAEQGKGKDVLMREVLDEAARRIEEASAPGGRFEDKPLVEALIRATLGDTYRKLGEYPAAEPHLQRARALRHRVLGPEHPETLRSTNRVAILYQGQGRYGEAEPLLRQALEAQRRVLGLEHPDTLASMGNLALLYWRQGRYGDAEPLLAETLDLKTRALGREHPDTLGSMNNLAILYDRQGRYEEAEPLYAETCEILKRVLGPEHPKTLKAINNFALLHLVRRRYDDAERLLVGTLQIRRRVLGDEHPDTLKSMNSLALVHVSQGRCGEAEPLARTAVEGYRRTLGDEHPDTLSAKDTLGTIVLKTGRFEEAERHFRSLATTAQRVVGEDHWVTPYIRAHHGMSLVELAQYEEAEPILLGAVAHLPPLPDNETEQTLRYLVRLYETRGKPEQAAAWRAKLPTTQDSVASD